MSCFCLKMKNGSLGSGKKNIISGSKTVDLDEQYLPGSKALDLDEQYLRGSKTLDEQYLPGTKTLDHSIPRFEHTEIEAMTRDFSDEKRIADNDFASVYMGSLPSGELVAVKRIKPGAIRGDSQFIDQIEKMKRAPHHPNLISLLGYCSTEGFQATVSEFAQNKNLSYHLHGNSGLSWDIRVKIAMGVAHALVHLHSQGVTHCDVKPANILLNNDFEAQVADFGCTKLSLPYLCGRQIENLEYTAPEYGIWGKCTDKSDVYSFGVILIEILSGRVNDKSITNEFESIAAWAKSRVAVALEKDDFSQLVDPKLEGEYNKGDVYKMAKAIVGCIKYKPEERPTMKEVLTILEGEADLSYKLVRSERSLGRERGYALSMKILLEGEKRYYQRMKKVQQTEEQSSSGITC